MTPPVPVHRTEEIHVQPLALPRLRAYAAGLAALRLSMGLLFSWAFIDKAFGLGFATKPEAAWINGGSPTRGFLGFAAKGPLKEFFNSIAGHPVTDGLFMLGLLCVGTALLLGIGVRLAGYSGALMVLLMWAAVLPPANNLLIDDHIVYALVLLLLPALRSGEYFGLGGRWKATRLVQRFPVLA